MKYIIRNGNELLNTLRLVDCKPGDTIQTLCLALFERGKKEGLRSVAVHLPVEFLADSYQSVPAMFARTLKDKCPYPNIKSNVKSCVMIVKASERNILTTFRARVHNRLEMSGSFQISKERAPMAYQERPALLSMILSKRFKQRVCNDCKNGRIRWFIKPVDSKR